MSKTAAIKAALPHLIADRDCLYEGVCIEDGSVPDERDRKDLADLDAVIDQCQAAIASDPRGHEHD